MADIFGNYSKKIFNELNTSMLNKLNENSNNEVETIVTNLLKSEDKLTEIENKLSITINKLIIEKTNKELNNDLNDIV